MARFDGKKWVGDAKFGADENGDPKRYRIRFDTEREALKFEANPASFFAPKVTVAEIFRKGKVKLWAHKDNEIDSFRQAEELIAMIGPDTDPKLITRKTVVELEEEWMERGNSLSTINKKLSTLSMLLKYAKDKGAIDSIPGTERHKVKQSKKRFLTEDEAARIANGPWSSDLYRDLFTFLLYTGCRYSEATDLKWFEVDLKRGKVTFDKTKGGSDDTVVRTIPLVPQARAALNPSRTEPFGGIDYWDFRREFMRVRYIAGIRDDRVTLHTLRHTCASWMVQDGVSLMFVQKWLGHAKSTTTEIYAHLAPDSLEGPAATLAKRGIKSNGAVTDFVPTVPLDEVSEQSEKLEEMLGFTGG